MIIQEPDNRPDFEGLFKILLPKEESPVQVRERLKSEERGPLQMAQGVVSEYIAILPPPAPLNVEALKNL